MEINLGIEPNILKAEGSYWTARGISAAAIERHRQGIELPSKQTIAVSR